MELIILLFVYFLPTIVANVRNHHNVATIDVASIVVINILLGWTFIGWVMALVMAFTDDKVKNV